MNLIELQRSLRQLRLGGMATVLETRLHQALDCSDIDSKSVPSISAMRPLLKIVRP